MRPPPWRPRALRLLLLILLVTAASCRRVSQPGPQGAVAASAGGAGGGGSGGHRLLLADTALPPADAEQVHRPFHLTLTTTIALALSVLVRYEWPCTRLLAAARPRTCVSSCPLEEYLAIK